MSKSLTASERSSGEEAFDMVVPGMKVNDFHLHRGHALLIAALR